MTANINEYTHSILLAYRFVRRSKCSQYLYETTQHCTNHTECKPAFCSPDLIENVLAEIGNQNGVRLGHIASSVAS